MKPTQSQEAGYLRIHWNICPGEHIYNVEQFEQFVLDIKEGKDAGMGKNVPGFVPRPIM